MYCFCGEPGPGGEVAVVDGVDPGAGGWTEGGCVEELNVFCRCCGCDGGIGGCEVGGRWGCCCGRKLVVP